MACASSLARPGAEALDKRLDQPDLIALLLDQELKRFPTLASDIAAAANEALERFRDESRKTVLRLVDMESSYLTVEFFRKLHMEPEKEKPNPRNAPQPNADIYSDSHFRKIGTSRLPHYE